MIRAVVFDLDDTLFPEREFVFSGFTAVNEWLERYYNVAGFFQEAKKLFEKGQRKNIFNTVLDQFHFEYDDSLIMSMVRVYREHSPAISLYKDAKWAIAELKEKNLLGIITDGYLTTQQNKVKSLGIKEAFKVIIYSDQYGREHWKPSQVPYLKIMEFLQCPGEECVYIGDNPCKDFITAKNLGWQTVHIHRIGTEYSAQHQDDSHRANFQVSSLYELNELIALNICR